MRRMLLLPVILLFMTACSKDSAQPVLGRAPLVNVVLHERQSELPAEWCGRGYKKRVLLHLSSFDDLEYLPEKAVKEITGFYRNKNAEELVKRADQGTSGLFSSRNTLYAAAKAGAVKEVYWVVPYKLAELAGGGVAIKNFLRTLPAFTDHQEIERMNLSGGCLAGTVNGVKLNVCSPNSLPRFKEPVIMAVNGDFFRTFAVEQGASTLRGMRLLVNALLSREIQVESLHVIRGVEEGAVQPVHSYICDEFIQAVINPQIMEQESAPPLWIARDTAENMLNGGERKLVRDAVAKSLKEFPDDNPLLMIDIAAQLLMGDVASARSRAEKMVARLPVHNNRSESQFIVQLGDMLTETRAGDPDTFYRLALTLHPGWAYAMAHRGNSLFARGRYQEAGEQFADLAAKRDGFILRIRRGDVESYLGKTTEALKYYDSARELYSERIGIPMSRENVVSLDRMESMYAQSGRSKEAAEIGQWKKQMNTMRQTR